MFTFNTIITRPVALKHTFYVIISSKMWLVITLIGVINCSPYAQGNCLNGGIEDERSNLCYYLGGVREDPDKIIGIKEYAITWIEAESECEKLNGHLAEINDDRSVLFFFKI